MNFQFLRYFCVLAQELHFGRAAEILSITQPPLSSAIKSLEQELGAELFLRDNKRKVELTAEGVVFLKEATQILEQVERSARVVRAVRQGLAGRLDIGLSPSLIYRGVMRIIQEFKQEYAELEIILHEMPMGEQVERLIRGQLDIGFANGAATPEQLNSLRLPDDRFAICLPENHPLAGRSEIDLCDLAHENFITFKRKIGPDNYDNVSSIFFRAGVRINAVHQVRSWFGALALVSKGEGLAVVPASLAQAGFRGVVFAAIKGEPALAPAMMIWNPDSKAAALGNFVARARRMIETKVDDDAARVPRPAVQR